LGGLENIARYVGFKVTLGLGIYDISEKVGLKLEPNPPLLLWESGIKMFRRIFFHAKA
jgi:hypothetical protein